MTEIRAKCPSCGEGVQMGAVFCIKCGTNIRTGQKMVTEQDAPPSGPAARRGPPPRRKPQAGERFNVMPFVWLLGIGAIAYVYLFQKDMFMQFIGRKGASSEASAPASGTGSGAAQGAAPAVAPEPAKEVNPNAIAAAATLGKIRTEPTNVVYGYEMLQLIQSLDPDQNNPDIMAGLKITYSLTRLMIGNGTEGINGLSLVRAGYSGSTFSSFLDPAAYYTACPACKGTPNTESVCSACGGANRCKVCAGKGALIVEAKKDAIQGPANRSKKFTPMGQTGSRRTVCANCSGNGRCPDCDGAGKIKSTCESCKGKGKNLDKTKIVTLVGQAVEKTLERLSFVETDLVLRVADGKPVADGAVVPAVE